MTDSSALDPQKIYRLGSDEHKKAFCEILMDEIDPRKPTVLPWPTLPDNLRQRFISLPFWDMLLECRGFAISRIQAMADQTMDPLISKAMGNLAFEKGRDKIILRNMLTHYGAKLEPEKPYGMVPTSVMWLYLRAGYSTCIDSFMGGGYYKVAQETQFLPPDVLELMDPWLQDGARHAMFFVNWLDYIEINKGLVNGFIFRFQGFCALVACFYERLFLFTKMKMPKTVLAAAVFERRRRLSSYDQRVARPKILTFFAKLISKVLK